MKTKSKILIVLLSCVMAGGIFYSCNKEEASQKINETFIENPNDTKKSANSEGKSCTTCSSESSWIPARAQFRIVEKKQVDVELKDGISYLGRIEGQDKVAYAKGPILSLTCWCKSRDNTIHNSEIRGTCSSTLMYGPFGFESRCVENFGCKQCGKHVWESVSTKIIDGGFVDFNDGIKFIQPENNKNILEERPQVFDAMFEDPKISYDLEKFMNEALKGRKIEKPNLKEDKNGFITPEDGYSFALLSIYGRIAVIALPDDIYAGLSKDGVKFKFKCICNRYNENADPREKDCKENGSNFGEFFYYECRNFGSCQSCTLKLYKDGPSGIQNPNGENGNNEREVISLKKYKY